MSRHNSFKTKDHVIFVCEVLELSPPLDVEASDGGLFHEWMCGFACLPQRALETSVVALPGPGPVQLPVHFSILGCFFFLFSYRVVRIKCNNKELSIFPKCKAAESSQSTLIITALLLSLRIHVPEIQWQPLTEDVLRFDLDVDVISNSLPIFVCWPSVGAWQGPFQASIHHFHPNSAAC